MFTTRQQEHVDVRQRPDEDLHHQKVAHEAAQHQLRLLPSAGLGKVKADADHGHWGSTVGEGLEKQQTLDIFTSFKGIDLNMSYRLHMFELDAVWSRGI